VKLGDREVVNHLIIIRHGKDVELVVWVARRSVVERMVCGKQETISDNAPHRANES